MERASAYFALADWFEYLNADCDYEQWSQYLHNELRALGVQAGEGLDIGCGGGYFTRAFVKKGYSMTGIDVSERMLQKAQRRSLQEGVRAEYVLSDILKLKTPRRADFALCVNDCINYVPPEKLTTALKRVGAALKKGGAFLFDISTEYKLREIVGNNTFCEDREDVAYLWFNTLFDDRVEMDITVFAKREDGAFERGDERHVQSIHTATRVRAALAEAGFSVVRQTGAFGKDDDRERLNFVCVRI